MGHRVCPSGGWTGHDTVWKTTDTGATAMTQVKILRPFKGGMQGELWGWGEHCRGSRESQDIEADNAVGHTCEPELSARVLQGSQPAHLIRMSVWAHNPQRTLRCRREGVTEGRPNTTHSSKWVLTTSTQVRVLEVQRFCTLLATL